MSLIRQTVVIAKNSKQNELKKLLFTLLLNIKRDERCLNFEVYEADEDDKEFLVYEEWKDEASYEEYKKTNEYLKFKKLKEALMKREEVLPNF